MPLPQRDPFNILYFHFDVIAFDHDFVTWNALRRWRPQDSAGSQVEIRTVPRTGDLDALNVAFRQRSTTVRTGVADGIVSSLHIKEAIFWPSIVNAAAWPGGTSLVLAILRSFAILLESV